MTRQGHGNRLWALWVLGVWAVVAPACGEGPTAGADVERVSAALRTAGGATAEPTADRAPAQPTADRAPAPTADADEHGGYLLPRGALSPRALEGAALERARLLALDFDAAVGALGDPRPDDELPVPMDGELVCVEPVLVTPAANDCCSYNYVDQVNATARWYRQPLHAFGTENDSETFAKTVRAYTPFDLPFSESKVSLSHGWFYNGGDFHAGFDYGKSGLEEKESPSFEVRAIAAGQVIAVFWDNWSGNIVIIEHTASNGYKYRSLYKHLRNGLDNDVAMGQGIPVASDSDIKVVKYNKFANQPTHDPLYWGTNAQKIAVKPGDWVSSGDFIAWAGNTGPGGAGAGLDNSGNVTNPATGNVHLHFMMTVEDPGNPGDWVFVDPYGVYEKQNTGCYELMKVTRHARLFTPFHPSFHNIPLERLAFYFGYYPGMGAALRTVNVHHLNGAPRASGSFQWQLSPAWKARLYMNTADYTTWFNTYKQMGLRPAQVSTVVDSGGTPRHTVIWKQAGNESYWALPNMTEADLAFQWTNLVVNQNFRIDDHCAYNDNGVRMHHVLYVKDGNPSSFGDVAGVDFNGYQQAHDAAKAGGYYPFSISADVFPWGTEYAGVFQANPGAWAASHMMTTAQYQQMFDTLTAQGYQLHRIQGYDNSNYFAAIFSK